MDPKPEEHRQAMRRQRPRVMTKIDDINPQRLIMRHGNMQFRKVMRIGYDESRKRKRYQFEKKIRPND